jgi:hypothetical protein
MAAACLRETGGGARREARNATRARREVQEYVPGKALSPRGIGCLGRKSPQRSAAGRMGCAIASVSRQNIFGALAALRSLFIQRGKVTRQGATPECEALASKPTLLRHPEAPARSAGLEGRWPEAVGSRAASFEGRLRRPPQDDGSRL